jgi:capsular exopolysaccharide synthesis family protein
VAQYDLNLRDYWRILRKRKGVLCLVTLAFAAMAFAFAEVQRPEPIYQATAVVKYERTTTLVGLLVESISIGSGDSIATQAAVVRSFPVLERTAKALGLIPANVDSETIKQTPRYVQLLTDMRAQVAATPEENTTLINIVVTSSDATHAARMANAMAQAYQEENTLLRNGQIREARRFIEEQLAEVTGRLRQAEEGMRSLKERSGFVSPADATAASMTRLAALEAEYEKSRRMQQETGSQWQALQDPQVVAGTVPPRIFTDANDPGISKLNTTLLDLTVERENLLVTLTPKHPQVVDLTARIAGIRESLVRELRVKHRALQTRTADLDNRVEQARQAQQALPDFSRRYAQFQREIALNENLIASLRTKLQEVQIKEKEQVAEVSLVRPAIQPDQPVNPSQTFAKVLVGMLIGLTVGLVLAFVLESMDTSIGTIQDVESYLEVPVLGLIPNIDPTRDAFLAPPEDEEPGSLLAKMRPFLVCLLHPRSTVAEAYRSLRTNVEFLAMEKHVKVICLTSASLMEGKTTTAINLALTIAQMGKKTLLVEADLRKPFLHHAFGIARDPGLTEVIVGNKDWHECVRGVTDLMLGPLGVERLMAAPNIDKLHLLTSGTPPPNPTEFLNSQRMTDLLGAFREEFDFVVLDCPPILPVTDAAILAAKTDGVLLVYRVGKIARTALKHAKVLLENVRGTVLGVVLTGLRAEISPDYEELQYYRYAYGHEPERQSPPALGAPGPAPVGSRVRGLFRRAAARTKLLVGVGVGLGIAGGFTAGWWVGGPWSPWVASSSPPVVAGPGLSRVPDRPAWPAAAPRPVEAAVAQAAGREPTSPGAALSAVTGERRGVPDSPPRAEVPAVPASVGGPGATEGPSPGAGPRWPAGEPAESASGPEPPQPSAGLFGIQVGSYLSPARATAHARALRGAGHAVAIILAVVPGRDGLWHRVILGRFETAAAAVRALVALQRDGAIGDARVRRLPDAAPSGPRLAAPPATLAAAAPR